MIFLRTLKDKDCNKHAFDTSKTFMKHTKGGVFHLKDSHDPKYLVHYVEKGQTMSVDEKVGLKVVY